MQWQSKTKFYSGLIFFILTLFSNHSFSQNNEKFRTPTKLYAGAYSIKVQLKKDFTEYDIPFWVKPDQAESTIDSSLLKELGYEEKDIFFQEVKLSGELIEKKRFKKLVSEWAFVPDFAKSCCHGVIGRDILQDFEVRFDPRPPAHLEWTRLITKENKEPFTKKFLGDLKKLFSLNQVLDIPFVLNLQDRKLEFEGQILPPKPTLFSFFFVPPERVLKVTSILAKDMASAKKVGFIPGLMITKINGENVSGLDRWVIEKYLRGEKSTSLKLVTQNKKEFIFDFNLRQFK